MFAYIALLAALVGLAHGHCSVNITTQLNALEPLFLRDGQLWAPVGSNLEWNTCESTIIACPGNNIVNTDTPTATITCFLDTFFWLNEELVNIADVACQIQSTGHLQNTGLRCARSGTLLNLGFDVPMLPFLTYIQSCYNMQTGSVIYSRHEIRGAAIEYKMTKSSRPNFRRFGTAQTVDPVSSYLQGNQFPRIQQLLGSRAQANRFINSISFLARGHLTPDADGIFRTWQRVSYFYVNAAPHWQIINNGNWKAVENAARYAARRMGENMLIFTGVHDILTLPNVNDQQVPITLDANGIEVPKWFWKVIKSPRTNAAIALVHNNDPFRTSMPTSEMLCQDVCAQYGWSNANYGNFARGYTYCCTVADLRRAIPTIPVEAHAAYVLPFNEIDDVRDSL